jgi:transcriptional regulator with XRE-family HTH domain
VTKSDDEEFNTDESPYNTLVGERLRNIRKQKKMSLQEVEATSNNEFKASVLGAYERGERALSVPRMERLARFYGVSIDQLLPRDAMRVEGLQPGASGPTKIRIDVAKLSTFPEPKFQMLERLLRMIQVQRQDFNGKVITVRAHDTRAISVILDVSVEEVGEHLAELGLIFIPPNQ